MQDKPDETCKEEHNFLLFSIFPLFLFLSPSPSLLRCLLAGKMATIISRKKIQILVSESKRESLKRCHIMDNAFVESLQLKTNVITKHLILLKQESERIKVCLQKKL